MEPGMRKFQSKVRNMNIGTLSIFRPRLWYSNSFFNRFKQNRTEFYRNIDMEIAGLGTPVMTYFRKFRLTLKSV